MAHGLTIPAPRLRRRGHRPCALEPINNALQTDLQTAQTSII
jgi:hypothetical protein